MDEYGGRPGRIWRQRWASVEGEVDKYGEADEYGPKGGRMCRDRWTNIEREVDECGGIYERI